MTVRICLSADFQLSGKISSAAGLAKVSNIPQEMFHEMPERVVELVQQMLDSSPDDVQSQDLVAMETKACSELVLDIWDFAGREAYYTTHQVFLASRAVYVFVFNLNIDLEEPAANTQVSHVKCYIFEISFFLVCHFIETFAQHMSNIQKTTTYI